MSESNSSLFTPRRIALSGVVGAAYAALTLGAGVFGIAYGPIQCRVSEALTVLPFLFPETVPGLFVGCLIANLLSPYGPLDIVFGSLATLLAALMTSRCGSQYLAPLPPVLCNMVLVGGVIAYAETGLGAAFPAAFAYNAVTVGIGEALSCYVLGLLLLRWLPKNRQLRAMAVQERLGQ